MAAVARETVFEFEPLAELAARTYGIYSVALALLPRLLRAGEGDDADSLAALSETGSMFASDLATSARIAEAHQGGERIPSSLPGLLHLLAEAFAAFAAIPDSADVKTLVGILPRRAEADALFDALMLEWGKPGDAPRFCERESPANATLRH